MSTLSINNNFLARNASRQLSAHYGALADSVRRISSGLRVEEAADDAAGLAIRELMRADVASLGQGARNANDAISLIQTADGALGIIDEKLIRMKELAEQAATGTYDSTQRLLINNEYLEMAAEIDRIARATDFNGVKLLDGSLSGTHDGSGASSADGLSSTGELKVHFGTANDSAEDYYYLNIGDCTLAGLGLAAGVPALPWAEDDPAAPPPGGTITFADGSTATINDATVDQVMKMGWHTFPEYLGMTVQEREKFTAGDWTFGLGIWSGAGILLTVPAGTKNFVFNMWENSLRNSDIQLFTKNGVHLAGTPPATDVTYTTQTELAFVNADGEIVMSPPTDLATYGPVMGFTEADYDGTHLNTGPANYNNGNTGVTDNSSLNWTTYNGMTIGYSGDSDTQNSGSSSEEPRYEVLAIDGEVTEDLYLWVTGDIGLVPYKASWDGMVKEDLPDMNFGVTIGDSGAVFDIATQDRAQKALNMLNSAIVRKDQVRAHLGAMQNRLENTVTNLNVQAENLLNAESRISDVDVATEMTTFVRNQVLTQSASAMLSQANAFPHMLMQLLQG